MTQTQSMPEFENDNLLSKVFTSKTWQKKLSNQNMNYQWIPCDQSQIQSMVSQVQVNIPNSYVDSCESDYFTFCMKMKIAKEKINKIYGQLPWATGAPSSYMIVQYKNALYMILNGTDNYTTYTNKILDKFVQAINSVDIPDDADKNWNTKDFGFLTFNVYNKYVNGAVYAASTSLDVAFDPATPYVATTSGGTTDTVLTGHAGSITVDGQVVGLTVDKATTVQVKFAYQKIMNLPYNSACFLDRSVLSHENVDKSSKIQQINRLIYRQQYDSRITQQYMDSHWYIYYHNSKPQVIYTNDYSGYDVVFSYQVMIPMNKIFWMWQADFLPLFKLKNPLNLQFVFNNKMIKELFEVMTYPQTGPVDGDPKINKIHASIQSFIDYNEIIYYNLGCYLLVCADAVLEKSVVQELNDIQGIILPQTQVWIEGYKTNTEEERQYQTNVGFTCLTELQLGVHVSQNQAYFRGYTSLKDICQEYKQYDSTNQIVQLFNPQLQDLNWYKTQLSFYMPQITFNAKQTIIGQKFMNSIPLFLSINNRGQDTDDQNPLTENMFDYFNKLNIRYEQFSDKYIENIEPNTVNYSGVSINKQSNNYITCLLTNYNTSDYSSNMTKFTDTVLCKSSATPTATDKDYFVELLYKYKQMLKIDQQGNLTTVLQDYML